MDKKLVVGNLKMYLDTEQVKTYLDKIKDKINNEAVVLCPSSLYLPYFIGFSFSVGSQNLAMVENGAYTGEISASQVASLGCRYAIVGHSERRQYFGELNEEIGEKMKQSLNANLIPIICIGETLEEYENNKTQDVLKKELIDAFSGIERHDMSKVVIAYEPIWAIGTGKIPTNEEIEKVASLINQYMEEYFQCKVKILYGGSVNSKNIEQLEQIQSIDGYLIGSAATKAEEILKIVEVVYS